MTTKKYEFVKNMRLVGITLGVVALVLLGFAIFKDRNINATNIISLAAIIVSLAGTILNKPLPPSDTQI
jgi:hypothetical protein